MRLMGSDELERSAVVAQPRAPLSAHLSLRDRMSELP